MRKTTGFGGLFIGCLLLVAGVAPVEAAPPTVAQMLEIYKPTFQDIPFSTPEAADFPGCEVKLISGTRPGSSGWLLLDAKKQPLRRYLDSNGDKKIDTWSWYKDGAEVYREVDSNYNERKDQFRWLNAGGMKWGVSSQEDGKIDAWQMISAEEVGQEVFAALANGDLARLQALFISQAEMRALKLPAEEAQRMIALQKNAAAKFQATRTKLPQLDPRARFVRLESATPNCVPAETYGIEQDLLRFPQRTVLFESGDKEKKHDWVQIGEMVKVGMAWRLVDGPSVPDADPATGPDNLALRKLFDELTALDDPKSAPPPQLEPKLDKAVQDYNLKRVALLEKILEQVKAEERDSWIKQMFDNLSAAYQAGHADSMAKLAAKRAEIVAQLPGSNLAAYGSYRELCAWYASKIGTNTQKVQDEWLDKLGKFAQAYPKADDTPDALWQLGMGREFSGNDEEAKGWYQQIYKNFPAHMLAAKAKGSERRLSLIGQPMELVGPQLETGAAFNIASLKGKVVVVYYWASTVGVCDRDFDALKRLRTKYADKLEVVDVNLDATAATATAFLQKAQAAGIHLYEASKDGGGLNSPLAVGYGINSLPHLFLVGADGRVLNRTLQVVDLENELKKAIAN